MLAVFTDNLPDPRPAVAESTRLAAIESYRLGGHAGDSDLDAVVGYMARAVRAPMAIINLVGPDQRCFPAEFGVRVPYSNVPDELSFCAYVVAVGEPLQVSDAQEHPIFRENPAVTAGGRWAVPISVSVGDASGRRPGGHVRIRREMGECSSSTAPVRFGLGPDRRRRAG